MGQPHIHLVYYEDLIMNLVSKVQRLNEFMGTNRSSEQVQEIAEATSFSKMKQGSFTPGYDNKVLLEVVSLNNFIQMRRPWMAHRHLCVGKYQVLMFIKVSQLTTLGNISGITFALETTTMLLGGTSEYIKEFKALCMMNGSLVNKLNDDKLFPSSRVHNTPHQFDAPLETYQNQKTVPILRNPRYGGLSYFHMDSQMRTMIGQHV
ncbi:uncharacterized protein [Watersipora subatra]|uniref:uncharacterized protein isoform X2 n=1 Tax=Watersipora subatra TaxID=2589382 RepID=UPI00355BFEAE